MSEIQSTNLTTLYDALHGMIDLRKFTGINPERVSTLFGLLHSSWLDRLRRIKLLGYAAHRYTSADHSRYAHAVGTMHVAQMMFAHLETLGAAPVDYVAVANAYGLAGSRPKEAVAMHLYVAALMQDVGELPYGQATQHVFFPNDALKQRVEEVLQCSVAAMSNKDIFTLSCLINEPQIYQHSDLDISFLAYLITGSTELEHDVPGLRRLHRMLDGVVDADRLDYVFRDSHHTMGAKGSAKRVIDTLVRVDDDSIVFNDTGAVTDFLITRAHLWNNVYLSPATRLRTLLLVVLIRELITIESLWPEGNGGALALEDFRSLDDVSLTLKLANITDANKRKKLTNRGCAALDILMGNAQPYEYVWTPQPAKDVQSEPLPIVPSNVFVDRYSDYQEKPLYKSGSIRIEAAQFRELDKSLTLEECSGTFGNLMRGTWTGIERPNDMAVYRPIADKQLAKAFSGSLNDERVRMSLWKADVLSSFSVPVDTREHSGFGGRAILISFTWANKPLVDSILRALFEKKHKYYALADTWSGLGETPLVNSLEAVRQAEAMLAIASHEYVDRMEKFPGGPLAAEWNAMCRKKVDEGVPLVVLSADPHNETNLPIAALQQQTAPFMGEPLRNAKASVISSAVNEVVKVIA